MRLREALRDLQELVFGATVGGSAVGSNMRPGGSPASTDPSTVFSRGLSFGPKVKVDIHGAPKSGKIAKTSGAKGKPGKVKFKSRPKGLAIPTTKREPARAQSPNVRGDRGGAKPSTGPAGRVR